jgi:hypothetical protein
VTLAEAVEPVDAIDMFFKALENQGRNPTLIRSGDISYEERSVRIQNSASGRSEGDAKHMADLERLITDAPSDIAREVLNEELRKARSAKDSAEQPAMVRAEMVRRDVFVGNNPRRRSRQEAGIKTKDNGLTSEQIIVSEFTGTDTLFISRMPMARLTSLRTNFFAIPSIEYCGRARSPMAVMISALLLADGGNHETFAFSPSAISSLKETFESIAATPGLGAERAPHLVSTDVFEGRDVFRIEFGMREAPNGVKMQTRLLSLTVDPSRGYIIPVEEEYHNGGLAVRFESSDYRQIGKDGIWFPWRSKEIRFQPATGELISEHEWQITTAALNEPVDPKEFEIAIPAGDEIDDFRSNASKGTAYRNEQPITLTANVTRDLKSIPGVIRPEVIKGRHLPGGSLWSWGRRVSILATVGVLLILVGIVVQRRQRS